ncbi:MAG: hypothetical protein LUD25_05210 [Coriobacteriaceae bacterium]|nr:hypothetical protein [Coriobacteriaceae bacterium]
MNRKEQADTVETEAAHAFVVDVSVAGTLRISGADAEAFLQVACASDLSATEKLGGLAKTLVLNSEGEIIDLVFLMRTGDAEYLMLTNPTNTEEVCEWLTAHAAIEDDDGRVFADVTVEDQSDAMAALMLFGTASPQIHADLTRACGTDLPYLDHEFTEEGYGVAELPCYLFMTATAFASQVGDFLNAYLELERLDTDAFKDLLFAMDAYDPRLADGAYFKPEDPRLERMLRSSDDFIGARALRHGD